jgi:hypothetical protein
MKLLVNNALLHPIRAIKIVFRRWLINRDNADPLWGGGDIPPALQPFQVGENLPWKGVNFKVGKVVGGAVPCIILLPVDKTRGAKLQGMRNFRDMARQAIKDQKEARI